VVKEAPEKYLRSVISFNHGLETVVSDIAEKMDFSPDIKQII
jgi:hypothetical protein